MKINSHQLVRKISYVFNIPDRLGTMTPILSDVYLKRNNYILQNKDCNCEINFSKPQHCLRMQLKTASTRPGVLVCTININKFVMCTDSCSPDVQIVKSIA